MDRNLNVVPPSLSGSQTSRNKPRHLVGLPDPSYRLLSRLSVMRGVPLSDALYIALRNDLSREESGEGWAFVPPPFSIKPSYIDDWIGVLFWNPFLPSPVLSGTEACRLADAIHDTLDGKPVGFEMVTGRGGHRVTLSRGPAHIGLHIDDKRYVMVRLVAFDVAAALESASVGASPRPYEGVH